MSLHSRFIRPVKYLDEYLVGFDKKFHPVIYLNIKYKDPGDPGSLWYNKKSYIVWKKEKGESITHFCRGDIQSSSMIPCDRLSLRTGKSDAN